MAFNKNKVLEDNYKALEIVFKVKNQSDYVITSNEIELLNNYAGFGGVKEILLPITDKSSWNTTDQKVYDQILSIHTLIKENTSSEQEYKNYINELRSNTLSAFFTPSDLCQTIVDALKEKGLQVSNALETSAGSGKFVDAVLNAYPQCKITAIEKDRLTAHILSAKTKNTGTVNVFAKGFEQEEVNSNYDLVISNIPFGNFKVFDKSYFTGNDPVKKASCDRIHNYFFVKGLDHLQDKGVLAYITTSAFTDSPTNKTFREHLVKHADLIDVVRLPNNLFKDHAGTEAATDLILLQKNINKQELSLEEKKFIDTVTLNNININQLFERSETLDDTRIISTENYIDTNQYGKPAYIHMHDGDIEELCLDLKRSLIDIQISPNKELHQERNVKGLKIGDSFLFDGRSAKLINYVHFEKENKYEIEFLNGSKLWTNQLYFDTRNINIDFDSLPKKDISRTEKSKPIRATAQLSLFDAVDFVDNTITIPPNADWYENDMLYLHQDKIVSLTAIDKGNKSASFAEISIEKAEDKAIFKEYFAIRSSYFALSKLEETSQIEQVELRAELNKQYDSFVSRYGSLHTKDIHKVLSICPIYNKILGILERRSLVDGKPVYGKGDILEKPISILNTSTPVYDVNEAIALCLNKYGKVNMGYILELTNKDKDTLQQETKNLLYFNPLEQQWETADQFLSGNVAEKKLAFEQKYPLSELTNGTPQLVHTYNAICSVQPEKIPFDLIDFNMGERWIDLTIYSNFAKDLFKDNSISIKYSTSLDKFEVDRTSGSYNPIISEEYAVKTQSHTIKGLDLFEHALHNTVPRITKNVGTSSKPIYVNDTKAMQEAGQKIDTIRERFNGFLKELPDAEKEKMTAFYNITYNGTVKRKYDGSHLSFADLENITPYKHQRDAAWMILQNNGGIVDHPVGSGKTLTMCMAAHEMKRLKLNNKPAIIGLKANIEQIAKEYQRVYPNDKLLYPTAADLEKDNRVEFFQQMQNQDWDCIIMTHEQFAKIPQSREVQKQIIEEELSNIEDDLNALRERGGTVSKQMLKGLEQRKLSKIAKLEGIYASLKTDPKIIDFASIGIDHVLIDESHKFKNLEFTTRHDRVAGLGNQQGSHRAFNLLTAIRTLQRKSGKDLGVTFLSGTTISNSLTEMYLLFKYLRPKALEKQRISNFDSWAAVFAQKSTEYEFNVTNELTMKDRFRTFIKVPELSKFYNDITDYKSFEDLKLDRPTPDVELVVCKQTAEQKEYAKKLIEFAKTGNASLIDRPPLGDKEKNSKMLIATNYAKKMAMDMRFIAPSYDDSPENKVSELCKNLNNYYIASHEHKGTQAVFCDMGTPGTDGFNIYKAIKEKLINEYNIPEKEIAFIHSAATDKKRDALFAKVNAGDVRIILGSTEKMGTGVNMQERMVAMHDLDIPWRPSDLEQRHGRGARKGNWVAKQFFNNKVKTFVYATESTLDVYKFNLLKNKQLFIDQIKNNTINTRTIDEGSMEESSGMSFAEYVAVLSGNNDLLEKAKIDNKIARIESEKSVFFRDIQKAEQNLLKAQNDIIKYKEYIATLSHDKQLLDSTLQLDKHGSKINAITLNGVNLTNAEPELIGKKILEIYKENKATDYTAIGDLYGFKLCVKHNGWENKLYAFSHDEKIKYTFNNGCPNMDNASYTSRYFMNALGRMENLLNEYKESIVQQENKIPLYREILKNKWPQEKEDSLQRLIAESKDIDAIIKESIKENDPSTSSEIKSKAVEVSEVGEKGIQYGNLKM